MPLLIYVRTADDSLARGDVPHAQAAEVRGRDLRHRVHYLHYWIDEARGKIFCLVDAPSAPGDIHRRAYSLLAKEVPTDPAHPARFETSQIYRVRDAD